MMLKELLFLLLSNGFGTVHGIGRAVIVDSNATDITNLLDVALVAELTPWKIVLLSIAGLCIGSLLGLSAYLLHSHGKVNLPFLFAKQQPRNSEYLASGANFQQLDEASSVAGSLSWAMGGQEENVKISEIALGNLEIGKYLSDDQEFDPSPVPTGDSDAVLIQPSAQPTFAGGSQERQVEIRLAVKTETVGVKKISTLTTPSSEFASFLTSVTIPVRDSWTAQDVEIQVKIGYRPVYTISLKSSHLLKLCTVAGKRKFYLKTIDGQEPPARPWIGMRIAKSTGKESRQLSSMLDSADGTASRSERHASLVAICRSLPKKAHSDRDEVWSKGGAEESSDPLLQNGQQHKKYYWLP